MSCIWWVRGLGQDSSFIEILVPNIFEEAV